MDGDMRRVKGFGVIVVGALPWLFVLFLLCAGTVAQVYPATCTWSDGSATGNSWKEASNWGGGSTLAGGDLVFSGGTGTLVVPQNVTTGTMVTVYAIARDVDDNFVANTPADACSLTAKVGGVVDGDLVAADNLKGAAPTGTRVGTGVIVVNKAVLTPTDSGLLTMTPGVVTTLAVSGFPTPQLAGISANVTITAQDYFGNTVTDYAGTVHVTTNDAGATLPADYTFIVGDAGVHVLPVTLRAIGIRSITVTDTVTSSITGVQAGISVVPPPPVITTATLPSGAVGIGFSQTLAALNLPTSWTIIAGSLPDGLVLTSGTGVISGTPTTTGTAYFTVMAGNISGSGPAQDLAITINDPPPVISTSSLPGAQVGVPYSQTLEASNLPTSWSVSAGGLPAGLNLVAATGVISGTPIASGTRNFWITARNAGGTGSAQPLVLTVTYPPVPSVTTATMTRAVQGQPYTATLVALNHPNLWSVSVGSLPDGLVMDSGTGVISGTPTIQGVSTFTVTAANISGVGVGQTLMLTVDPPAPVIGTTSLMDGTLGIAYVQNLVASSSPTSWMVSVGHLPAGLSLITATGGITGMPTETGTSHFTVTASNLTGTSAGQDLTIVINDPIPVVGTASLPDGIWGAAYRQTLVAANHATSWMISGGLPDGLVLDAATGVISGIPTKIGTTSFTVTAGNVSGTSTGQSLSITISAMSITATSSANGVISPGGVTAVPIGGSQIYSITPVAGYQIATLMVDGSAIPLTNSYTFTNIQSDHTIVATFSPIPPITFTVTTVSGANGTVTPAGVTSVVGGRDQICVVAPAVGYRIATLMVDGAAIPPAATYVFTALAANHTLEATFEPIPVTYVITASCGAHGTVNPLGATELLSGDSQTYVITPDATHEIATVTVDGVALTTPVATYTFSAVDANHTIAATFADLGSGAAMENSGVNTGPSCGVGSGTGLVLVFGALLAMVCGSRIRGQDKESPFTGKRTLR